MNSHSTRSSFPTSVPHHGNRRGSVVVIVAASMAFILGCGALSLDYGLLVNDANKTQRAVDAAALAAASELRTTTDTESNKTKARAIADVVAKQNGINDLDTSLITFINPLDSTTPTKVKVVHTISRNFLFGSAIGIRRGSVTRAATAVLTVTSETANGAPMGVTEETANYYKTPERLSPANNQPVGLTLIRTNKTSLVQKFKNSAPVLDPFLLFDLRGTQMTPDEGGANGKSPAQMLNQFLGETSEVATKNGYETALNAEYKTAQLNKLEEAITTIFARSASAPWNDTSAGWNDGTEGGTKYSEISASNASAALRSNPRVVNVIVTPKRLVPEGGNFNAKVLDLTPVYLQKATITQEQSLDSAGNPEFDKKGNPITETTIKLWVRFLTPTTGGGGGQAVNETSVGESSGNYSISLAE